MKWAWVLVVVLFVPVSVQAERSNPQTIEGCTAINETWQAQITELVKNGVQCQMDIRADRAKVFDLTACGPCCERMNGKPGEDPLNPGFLDHCLFPQTCAANREQQYCALAKWMAVRKHCTTHVVGYDDIAWAKADRAAYKSMYEGVRLKTDAFMDEVFKPLKKLQNRVNQRRLKQKITFFP